MGKKERLEEDRANLFLSCFQFAHALRPLLSGPLAHEATPKCDKKNGAGDESSSAHPTSLSLLPLVSHAYLVEITSRSP